MRGGAGLPRVQQNQPATFLIESRLVVVLVVIIVGDRMGSVCSVLQDGYWVCWMHACFWVTTVDWEGGCKNEYTGCFVGRRLVFFLLTIFSRRRRRRALFVNAIKCKLYRGRELTESRHRIMGLQNRFNGWWFVRFGEPIKITSSV